MASGPSGLPRCGRAVRGQDAPHQCWWQAEIGRALVVGLSDAHGRFLSDLLDGAISAEALHKSVGARWGRPPRRDLCGGVREGVCRGVRRGGVDQLLLGVGGRRWSPEVGQQAPPVRHRCSGEPATLRP